MKLSSSCVFRGRGERRRMGGESDYAKVDDMLKMMMNTGYCTVSSSEIPRQGNPVRLQ